MADRRFGALVYVTIKSLTRDLIEKHFGHQKVAAAATRVEQGAVSDYGNTARMDRVVPVDVLMDWTAKSGDASVFTFVAEQLGCLLVPLPHGIGHTALTERSSRTAQEFGEVMAGILAALGDGRITKAEAPPILANIHELMIELSGLAEAVKAAAERDAE